MSGFPEYIFIVDRSIKYLLPDNNVLEILVMATVNNYIVDTDICFTTIHNELTLIS
jgi:hypothetical protein